MKTFLRNLFAAKSAPAAKPARLGLTALEAREMPAVFVAPYGIGLSKSDAERADARIAAGDVVVGGARHVLVEADRGGVKVTTEYETTTLAAKAAARVWVFGTAEADRIENATARETVVFARGGADDVRGGSGNDLLFGEAGNDDVRGYAGADRLYGDGGWDDLRGEDGDDFVYGGADNDRLEGNQGDDRLFGEGGNDALFGDGWDIVWVDGKYRIGTPGPAGADILDGGAGTDTFYGGGGRDTFFGTRDVVRSTWFWFETVYYDTILDLNRAEGDWAD